MCTRLELYVTVVKRPVHLSFKKIDNHICILKLD